MMSTSTLTLDELTEQIRDIALQVSAAQERVEERDFVASTHVAVEKVAQNYRDFYATLSEGEKMKVERGLGRRLLDVKRLASLLPRVGNISATTPDRQVTGASAVGERRITGVSWNAGARGSGPGSGHKVGGDIEAWCSPCGGLTDHSIVAMVGDEPKQVVCQSCNGRHAYRTTPARARTSEPETAAKPVVTASNSEREAVRRADQKAAELRALASEIAQATEVRSFDPKSRYRPGDIISHPDFGRGKVETVLRSSLLVRFSQGGLKSVMLS